MNQILLEGPGKNALSSELMDLVLARLREANGAPLLITGAGDAFSAGLNLKELSQLDEPGMEAYLRKLETMVETLYTYPGPTVAAINGHAIAGGSVVGLCCDHQVSTSNPNVKIGLNEVALGLCFPPITLAVVRERLPKHFLNQVILRAQLHSPAAALRIGLIDEVAEDVVGVATERLAELAAHPSRSYATAKSELRGALMDSARSEAKFMQMLPAWTAPSLRQRLLKMLKR